MASKEAERATASAEQFSLKKDAPTLNKSVPLLTSSKEDDGNGPWELTPVLPFHSDDIQKKEPCENHSTILVTEFHNNNKDDSDAEHHSQPPKILEASASQPVGSVKEEEVPCQKGTQSEGLIVLEDLDYDEECKRIAAEEDALRPKEDVKIPAVPDPKPPTDPKRLTVLTPLGGRVEPYERLGYREYDTFEPEPRTIRPLFVRRPDGTLDVIKDGRDPDDYPDPPNNLPDDDFSDTDSENFSFPEDDIEYQIWALAQYAKPGSPSEDSFVDTESVEAGTSDNYQDVFDSDEKAVIDFLSEVYCHKKVEMDNDFIIMQKIDLASECLRYEQTFGSITEETPKELAKAEAGSQRRSTRSRLKAFRKRVGKGFRSIGRRIVKTFTCCIPSPD